MSDDLVKLLKHEAEGAEFSNRYASLCKEAADRIEELEQACDEWAEVSQNNYQRAKAAEAALREIAKPKAGPNTDWTQQEIYKWRATWYAKYESIARDVLNKVKD